MHALNIEYEFAALRGLRIGCVSYLNARPLIDPYDGAVVQDHPSAIAAALVRGELDVALVPVFEALRHPEFLAVDSVSISSFGPVWSVFVAYKGERRAIREIALDPASLTSVHLCKALFAEEPGAAPVYTPEPGTLGAARLIIGNQAIAFREKHGNEYRYLDLGEEWTRRTGLPFVFAIWLMRPETAQPERAAEAFRKLACRGCASIPEIVARHHEHSASFSMRYLTEHIRFALGAAEKQGIQKFRDSLEKLGLLPCNREPLRFI